VGVGLGVGVAVGVDVGVWVGVGVAVDVGVFVGMGVLVDVGVGVANMLWMGPQLMASSAHKLNTSIGVNDFFAFMFIPFLK